MRERQTSRESLLELLQRHAGRTGSPALRAVLGAPGGPAFLRSEAEGRFLALVRKARLPPPECNTVLSGHEVDFLWRPQRLAVEIDGRSYHDSAAAMDRDRDRDADLAAAGFRVVRVTWTRLDSEPEAVLVRVAQALVRTP